MFMSGEGCMLLKRYGHVLFMDFKASGLSSFLWPYGTISVSDEENHSIICTHSFLITESNAAYEGMLHTAVTWVPVLKQITKMTRTDDLVISESLQKFLPSLCLPGLCNIHIREINFKQHLQAVYYPNMDEVLVQFCFQLQEARVSETEWETVNYPQFKSNFPGAPAPYVTSIFPSRKRWALAFAREFLTPRTGNNTAEQGMHSVGTWFVENKEHCEAVERLVHYDSERHRRLREEIFEMKSKCGNRIQRIKQPDLRQCTERFSSHALKLFNARLSDAMNYKCESVHQGICWKVKRKTIETTKSRVVS